MSTCSTAHQSSVPIDFMRSLVSMTERSVVASPSGREKGDLDMLHFISFGGREDLLRASPLSSILAGGAKILTSSGGDAQTYALSSPVEQIDVFISHNWVTERWQKFLALSLHFNFWPAAAASFAVQAVAVALTGADLMPHTYVYWSDYPRGVACRIIGIPTFLVMLLVVGDLRRFLGLKGPAVFLDKTCIHQSDADMMDMGIAKLGAFLSHSKKMLVLYTDQYLQRLWTMYEFGCFCSLHPSTDICMLPVFFAKFTFAGLICVFVAVITAVLMEAYTKFYMILEVAMVIGTPWLAAAFRYEARERRAMRQRFTDFTVDGCTCAREEDRPRVYGNIADLMRAAEVVLASTPQDQVMDEFNWLVRKKMPRIIESAHSKNCHRYGDLVTLSIATACPSWFDSMAGIPYGMLWSEAAADSLTRCTFIFATMPLGLAMICLLMRHCLDLRGAAEVVFVCVGGWLCAGYVSVVNTAISMLWNNSRFPEEGELDWAFWANIVLVTVNVLAVVVMFGHGFPKEEWLVEKCELQLDQAYTVDHKVSGVSSLSGQRRVSEMTLMTLSYGETSSVHASEMPSFAGQLSHREFQASEENLEEKPNPIREDTFAGESTRDTLGSNPEQRENTVVTEGEDEHGGKDWEIEVSEQDDVPAAHMSLGCWSGPQCHGLCAEAPPRKPRTALAGPPPCQGAVGLRVLSF